jgi:hypothetical protein
MRRIAGVVALLLAVVGLSGVQPVGALDGARCTATLVIVLDPGFSMEPTTGTHRSENRARPHRGADC